MTLYRRPQYTKEVLDALAKCDGIEDYLLMISVDGKKKNPEILALVNDFDACAKQVLTPEHLGCGPNTYYVLSHGFLKTDYVIHLEDDTVPAFDTLRYFEWARQFETDDNMFSVTAYSRYGMGKYTHVGIQPSFCPWGWATWASRWLTMRNKWRLSWDTYLNEVVRGDKMGLFPIVSRIQNIGAIDGEHVGSVHFHQTYHHTPYWIGDDEVQYNKGYTLV